jgi:ADP-L-glycero-D-manno-heptose 6-epimerase
MNESSPIVVTGGGGLIGSAVIRHLNSIGRTDIMVVDKLGSCPHKWKNLRGCRFRDYEEYVDQEHLVEIVDDLEPSAVIHLGANSSTTETDVAHLMENNYDVSKALGAACSLMSVRFVYASSAATYGADVAMDDTAEIDDLIPLNPYGYSKHLTDLWMRHANPNAVGLKYTNVFGRGEYHKGDMRSMVCKGYQSLIAGEPIRVFESARADIATKDMRRDFISVEDAAKITVWFALDLVGAETAGLYNVGSGEATSFEDLALYTAWATSNASAVPLKITRREVQKDWWGNLKWRYVNVESPFIEHVPMPEHLQSKYQYYTCAPISKLRAAGYSDEITPVKTAVGDYVKWMAKETATNS